MVNSENMLPVGTMLHDGAYRIEQQLASGGFGNTYKVKNSTFGDILAMKEFFIRGINLRTGHTVTVATGDNQGTFLAQKDKFAKEAMRLRRLDSPHLVRVYDLFEENGTVYYVMDYIDGENLSQILQREGPIGEDRVLGIMQQMLQVLDTIHHDVPPLYHLDIKPGNIMVDKKGKAFLVDFGSSKQFDVEEGVTMSSGLAITRDYAPVELVNGDKKRIGPWTDIYELGATFYAMLTAQRPPSTAELTENPHAAFRFLPSTTPHTVRLVTWMMSLNRYDRPQDISSIRAFIDEGEKTQVHTASSQSFLDKEKTMYNSSPTDAGVTTSGNINWKKYAIIGVSVVVLMLLSLLAVSLFKGNGEDTPTRNEITGANYSMEEEREVSEDVEATVKEDKDGEVSDESAHEEDVSDEDYPVAGTQDRDWIGLHHLKGNFYNSSKSWPVEVRLYVQGDGSIEGATYNNISQHVTISSMSGYYDGDGGTLYLRDNDNLILQLSHNPDGSFSGIATSGSTTLNASFSEVH